MNIDEAKNALLSIKKFNLSEAFNSANGKTEMVYICAPIIILSGAILPFVHPELGAEAFGFITAGAALLGVKVVSPTKEITAATNPTENDNNK